MRAGKQSVSPREGSTRQPTGNAAVGWEDSGQQPCWEIGQPVRRGLCGKIKRKKKNWHACFTGTWIGAPACRHSSDNAGGELWWPGRAHDGSLLLCWAGGQEATKIQHCYLAQILFQRPGQNSDPIYISESWHQLQCRSSYQFLMRRWRQVKRALQYQQVD